MFIVCNKDKIASYMVSFFTVMILLGIAFYMRNNSKMLEVSSTSKQLPIYSVKTDEKKVAFTMNCAWKANKYYEKHPLLGAADRATLYAFVARKQPHE